MKVTVVLLVVVTHNIYCQEFKLSGLFFGCERDVTLEYHCGLQDFSTRLYKRVAEKYNYHFALSQYSIWLSLSALAESSDGDTRAQLFKSLNLPQDDCLREKYYEIATSLESPGNDVTLKRKRLLVLDDNLKVNKSWISTVRASGLIDTLVAPIKDNPEEIKKLEEVVGVKVSFIEADAMILDSLDYEALWTTAFDNSSIKQADFYNDDGTRIGTIDLMTVAKRVKVAYIPLLHAKLLELPVGNNGRYRMLIMINAGRNSIKRTIEHFPSTIIIDSMPLLIESLLPMEVAIPRFEMTSEMDLKDVLVDIGFGSIWKDIAACKYISEPPVAPSTIVQRVKVTFDGAGVSPSEKPWPMVGRQFIVNRPFVYGLVDSLTRTWLFSGAVLHP